MPFDPTERFMYDQNVNSNSVFFERVDVDAFGMAGYSLGGGRIVKGLAAGAYTRPLLSST